MAGPAAPPAEEIETPQPPDESAPPPAQEPSPPDEGDDESGAPEAEDEDSGDPSATLLELLEENPELLTDEVKQKLGIKDAPEEDLSERELAVETEHWQAPLKKVTELVSGYAPDSIQKGLTSAVSSYMDQVEAALKKAAESGEAADVPDARELYSTVYSWITGSGAVWFDYQDKAAKARAFDAVKPDLKYLTSDEKKTLRAAREKPLAEFHTAFYGVMREALLRAAPEAEVEKRFKELDKKTGQTEKLAKLAAGLSKNGKRPRTDMAPAPTTRYRTKMEARTLHAEGKMTNAEMRRVNADPTVPEM